MKDNIIFNEIEVAKVNDRTEGTTAWSPGFVCLGALCGGGGAGAACGFGCGGAACAFGSTGAACAGGSGGLLCGIIC